QVVRLAFEYARADAKQLAQASKASDQTSSQGAPTDASAQYQRLNQAAQKVDQQLQETQEEVQSFRDQLSRAPSSKRAGIRSQIDEIQSEIGLLQVRKDALENLAEFVTSGGDTGAPGLSAQIEALARSVPASLSRGATSSQEGGEQPFAGSA